MTGFEKGDDVNQMLKNIIDAPNQKKFKTIPKKKNLSIKKLPIKIPTIPKLPKL